MQHLGVLVEANLILAERRGRDRVNYLNAVPLREYYERWVQPFADSGSAELLALKRLTEGGNTMTDSNEPIRTVRLSFELRIKGSARRTFEVMTQQSLEWFPHTYGGERTRSVVVEPRVGGLHYEDWGDSAGHLYGQVTVYDPPTRWATRGRLSGGSILDTDYQLAEEEDSVVVRVTKVAVGPFTDEEVAGINEFGDIRPYASAIERLAAGSILPAGFGTSGKRTTRIEYFRRAECWNASGSVCRGAPSVQHAVRIGNFSIDVASTSTRIGEGLHFKAFVGERYDAHGLIQSQ